MGWPIPKGFGAVASLAGRQPVGELAADCVTVEVGDGRIRAVAAGVPAALSVTAPGPAGEVRRVAVPAKDWQQAFQRLKGCDSLTLDVQPGCVTLSASCGESVAIPAAHARHPVPAAVVPSGHPQPLAVVEAGDLLAALRALVATVGKSAPVALCPRTSGRAAGCEPVGLLLVATGQDGVEARAGVRPAEA